LETNYFSKFGGYNMSFNYGLEKKKFDREWARLREEYRAAGMDEASIEAMYEFDWQGFNSERAYRNHTQGLPFQQFDDDGDTAGEDTSALLVKFFDAFAVMPQETDSSNRYGWVDSIESEVLSAVIRKLSKHQLELLTFIVEGCNATEAGKMLGLTQQGASWHIRKIKKLLKNFKKNL
jgi:hypothetical protein